MFATPGTVPLVHDRGHATTGTPFTATVQPQGRNQQPRQRFLHLHNRASTTTGRFPWFTTAGTQPRGHFSPQPCNHRDGFHRDRATPGAVLLVRNRASTTTGRFPWFTTAGTQPRGHFSPQPCNHRNAFHRNRATTGTVFTATAGMIPAVHPWPALADI